MPGVKWRPSDLTGSESEEFGNAIILLVSIVRQIIDTLGMKSPRFAPDHPDRILDLEEEMELHLVALMDRAREAGWHQEDVVEAVMSLARNYMLQLDANLQTDLAITSAMKDAESLH